MDAARADALAARSQLATQGWFGRRSESFRHLPPPHAAQWLGSAQQPLDPEALPRDGWTLQGGSDAVDARWLDVSQPSHRFELLAGLPAPGGDEAAPFAWAHRALLRQGLRLRIAAGTPAVHLSLHRRAAWAAEAPLLVVDLQPGARCVLHESHERDGGPPVAQNLQVHVRLGEGAELDHVRVAAPGPQDSMAHHVHVRLARGARYAQCLLASGSAYHLQRNVFELQGDGASARAGGVLLAAGSALEQQVLARHAAPRTRSVADVLALASGAARMVANAHTHIAAGSDDADTRQHLAGIPTGGQPRIVLRPHLEILHDQVQAAHGATWGALPQDALFLARQRGLDATSAQALIIEGMARAVLARALDGAQAPLPDAALAQAVARHLAAHGEERHG